MTRARSPAVDTIRAAALMGICVVNLPFLGQPIEVVLAPPVGTVDTLTWIFTSTLFQSKFFLLFSFLFGWGFGAQAAAAAREGRALGPRTARRARAATWTGPKPAPPWPCLAPPGPPRLA